MFTTSPTQLSVPSQSKYRALVIDHDPINRSILGRLLESEGCYVIEVENGIAVIDALHEIQPDIVLLNAMLPGDVSFELCAQIQVLPNDPVIPVLMVTDNEDEDVVDRSLAAGAADYVTKPIRPRILRQRIRRLLQAHQTSMSVIRAKKEWEAAFDAVSDMIILTDLDGKIIRCNRATIQRLESSYLQLIGFNFKEILFKDGNQEFNLTFGQSLEMQLPALHGWFEIRMFPGQMGNRPRAIVYVFKDITERKQLEDNLQKSERRFKALVENISEGIQLFDAEGKVLYASPMVAQILGLPEGTDLVGRNPMDKLHPAEFESNRALYTQLLQEPGGSVTTELRMQSADRSWIWTEVNARNMLTEPGINAILVNFRDITERKRAEVALAESEQRFRQLFEASPEAMMVIDPNHSVNWVIMDCNEAACRMNGYTRDDMIGKSIDFLHDTVRTVPEREGLLERLQNEEVVHLEIFHRHKSGRIFPVDVSTTLFTLGGRQLILGIDRDVTERRQAEEALRLSEERFQLVTLATNDAVWDLSLATGKRWWNVGLRSLFGYTPDEVAADQIWWEAQIHPDDRAKVLTSFRSALTGDGQFWSKEYRFCRADGTYAYVFDRGYIIQGSDGSPVRVLGAMMDISDRKQFEGALRRREQQLKEAQQIAQLGSWEWDSRTNSFSWSDELYRLCGWGPRAITPSRKAFTALIHPDDREIANEMTEKAFQTNQPYDFDCRIISAKGETRWLHTHGEFLKDEYGQFVRLRGIAQDISERKQAEQALRASQAELSEALQIARLAYWEYDVPNDLFTFNDHFYSIFHTTASQEGGYKLSSAQYAQKFCHPDDRTVVGTEIQKALNSTDRYYRTQLDHRILYADGGIGYISVRVNIDRDEAGHILRFYGANQDITERKHMEEALRKSEELFSKAFHASPAPMSITRVDDGLFIDVNGSWERLLGYRRETIIGQSILDLNIIVNPDNRLEIVRHIREQGQVADYKIKANTQSGEERDLLMSAQIVEIQGKDCLLSTFYDLTELQNMHEAMLASQKLADLGTLAAGVAHEMNSPLQVITGVSESLLKKVDNGNVEAEQLKHNLDVIHRNGWRCAEIVRSLHTYARNSGGSMEPTNLNELVTDGLLLIEHQLKSWANISVKTILAEGLAPLICDRNQITQVLINILTNARDAMPNGGEITIATGHDPKSDQLILQISDTGIGIPDSIRNKIFDPFFTTKPLGKGTGLGLSIVAGIVRAHAGTIEANVAVPQGTTFTARFPAKPIKLPDTNPNHASGRFDESVDFPLATAQQINFAKELSHD